MNFRPLGNRVLVLQREAQSKSAGGIFLPENSQRKPLEGEIVAVGPGTRTPEGDLVDMDVTVGNHILIAPGTATEIVVEGTKYLILTEADIIGIVD